MAKTGRVADPLLVDILTARLINQAFGGAFIAPWEVGMLPDEIIDAIRAWAIDYPAYKDGTKKVEDYMARWRASHPTYRK